MTVDDLIFILVVGSTLSIPFWIYYGIQGIFTNRSIKRAEAIMAADKAREEARLKHEQEVRKALEEMTSRREEMLRQAALLGHDHETDS